jgi:hypothetical protein
MIHSRTHQRGEGRIGCVLSLLVFLALGGVCFKLVPVYYANNQLAERASDLASQAGVVALPSLEAALRDKAKELEIPEALEPEAMTFRIQGEHSAGTCSIRLNYSRKVDLFGMTTLTVATDKTVSRTFVDAR